MTEQQGPAPVADDGEGGGDDLDLDAPSPPPSSSAGGRGGRGGAGAAARSGASRDARAGTGAGAGRDGRRVRARRRLLPAVVAALLLLAALVGVQQVRAQRAAPGSGLVAVGGGLAEVTRPTSGDNNTRAVLSVRVRNDAGATVTLLSLRPTSPVAALMSDDLRSSGGESMGLEQGLPVREGQSVLVVVAGPLRCPGRGESVPGTGSLRALVRDDAGRRGEVVLAPPDNRSWPGALRAACALGPAPR